MRVLPKPEKSEMNPLYLWWVRVQKMEEKQVWGGCVKNEYRYGYGSGTGIPYPTPPHIQTRFFSKKILGLKRVGCSEKKSPNLYLNTYCALRSSWQLLYSYAPTNLIFCRDTMHFNYEYYFLNLINPTCIILILNM